MRIFPAPLNIGETEGFTPEKDIFGRANLGLGLANLVGSVTEPMVLAVDGQWGSGKTTFLKMWAGLLRQQGFPVIYFDAFENDYVDDAFAALAAEVIGLVEAEKKSSEPKAKEFKDKAFGALKVISRSALKVGVKAASMGALDAAKLSDDLVEAISSEAEELTDKHIGELLTKQAERREALQGFKDALRDLPGILAPPAEHSELDEVKSAKPLVFVIDELDRCRPVFALQMLERIKHFFSVSNVHFVLGTHMGQLRTSVQAAYGGDIDAHTYLQKFIQVTFPLVDTARHPEQMSGPVYVRQLTKRLDFHNADHELMDAAVTFITSVTRVKSLSLRSIERIMTAFAIAVAFTSPRSFRPGALVAGLCVLRVVRPELYAKAKSGTLTFEEVAPVFGFGAIDEDERPLFNEWSVSLWQYVTQKNAPDHVVSRFNQSDLMWRYNFRSRFEVIPLVANNIVDMLHATS